MDRTLSKADCAQIPAVAPTEPGVCVAPGSCSAAPYDGESAPVGCPEAERYMAVLFIG